MRRTRTLVVAMGSLLAVAAAVAAPRFDGPVAIRDVTAVVAPGRTIEHATLVLRDGRIAAVGADVAIPPGALVIDGSGHVAYAGFVDGFARWGIETPELDADDELRVESEIESIADEPHVRMPRALRRGIFARRRVQPLIDPDSDDFAGARKAGFAAALLAPPRAMLAGRPAVVTTSDRALRDRFVAERLALAAAFAAPPRRQLKARGGYPATLLGITALLRQTMLDADWYAQMHRYARRHPKASLPADEDLAVLAAVRHRNAPVFFEANAADEINRALDLADEFALKLVIVGGREADLVADRLKATRTPVAFSLKLPEEACEYKLDAKKLRRKPDDETPYGRNWNKRPFYPERAYALAKAHREQRLRAVQALEQAGVKWCFTTYELDKPGEALKRVRELIEAGLDVQAAVAGLTSRAAEILGVAHELGTLEPGKRACVTLLTAAIGDEDAKVHHVIVDGRDYRFDVREKPKKKDKSKNDKGADAGPDAGGGLAGGPSPSTARNSGGQTPSSGRRQPGAGDPQASPQPQAAVQVRRAAKAAGGSGRAQSPDATGNRGQPSAEPAARPGPLDDILLHRPEWPVESEADREPAIRTHGNVLLKNATVLTVSGPDLPNTSVLIQNGRITKIGRNITPPAGVTVIDLTGYYIMPGIIDPHSHIASYAVNEWTDSVTPEVRIADVLRPRDPSIYFALTGGVTTIHTMHGSANSIGGQNALMKLKYGRPAREMLIDGAPRTVKFALGENVKRPGMRERSFFNRDSVRRFPGTRMGVETTIRRALYEGRKYLRQRQHHKPEDPPLRRDLRLEALADILEGRLWINAHCYRSDEILRLIDVAEDYGVRIAAFHHVLEGYRIMPEIARHGASTATFSDWWAYKVEAYEAIPQNAGMMLRYGINSAIKSDSGELMRHLNLEAAKCMKYSSLAPNETLRLITLNPARMFGLDDRIGSIEVGKDGDIAVFNGHPLDTFARCVMTLIEGEVYFTHRDFDPRKPGRPKLPAGSISGQLLSGNGGQLSGDGFNPRRHGKTPLTVNPRPRPNTQQMARSDQRGPHTYAIVNGTVHPVSGPPVEQGTVIIRDGRIAAVGHVLKIPDDARIIDARGLHVWPGIINAATQVGLHEIGAVGVTVDTDEPGIFQPDVLAVSAFHPHSAMIGVTRADGVLTTMLVASGPIIAGQAGVVDLDGWTMPEMLVEAKVGLVVNLPSPRGKGLFEREEQPPQRDPHRRPAPRDQAAKQLEQLRTFFRDAKRYAEALRDAEARGIEPPIPTDPRFDAMVPYVLGEQPVLFNVGSYKAILEALMFADQFGLRPIILGGRDAWKLADVLAKRHVPVIYEGTFGMPSGLPGLPYARDAWDGNYRAAGVMQRAGVKFCFSVRSASLAKLVPVQAGMAVAHGLDPEAAVRAMTLWPAEILGIADRYGSLERGKVANVIVTTGHLAQATSKVRYAFIRGRLISLESKHTRNAEKFANRPEPHLPPPRTDLVGPPSRTR